MNITLHGAAGGEVTGSCYHVHTGSGDLLVDMGLFQGRHAETRNIVPHGVNLSRLGAVVLTHAHLDHTGRLPLLARHGFKGAVYGTPATLELARIILRDSAKIQEQDAERDNRRNLRTGRPPRQPLYTIEDAERLFPRFREVPYDKPVEVLPDVSAVWAEAGHMLGSTSIRLDCREAGESIRTVFSGDIGPRGAPILRDAEGFSDADLCFVESTYGDRDHRPFAETVEEFFNIVAECSSRRGKILVPTFAIGRAQLMIVLMAMGVAQKRFPPMPVFLDSPMAIEALKVYEHHHELFDDEMNSFLKGRDIGRDIADVRLSGSADESKAINHFNQPCMILAGAGMCNAGRIVHHLRNHLWKPETTVLIVGYQGEGTIGRQLVDGREHVNIFGEQIIVRAAVHTLGGFSGHAGQTDLLAWMSVFQRKPCNIHLTHGEDRARKPFADALRSKLGLTAQLPELEQTILGVRCAR
jgi:metallo-beta-lactamase family protein